MLNMFDVLLFKEVFGKIQVGLLNKINKFFFFFYCQQVLQAAALITGKAWTGQQPETRVSRSHPAPLETRKEWEHSQWRWKLTQIPDSVGSSHLRLVLTRKELSPNPISVISGGFERLPLQGSGILLADSTLWGCRAIPSPSRWHHTIVLFSPEALRSAHTLHSILSALQRLNVSAQRDQLA